MRGKDIFKIILLSIKTNDNYSRIIIHENIISTSFAFVNSVTRLYTGFNISFFSTKFYGKYLIVKNTLGQP